MWRPRGKNIWFCKDLPRNQGNRDGVLGGIFVCCEKITFLYCFFTHSPTIFSSGISVTDCVSVNLVHFDGDLLHEISLAFLWTYLHFYCNLKMNFTAQLHITYLSLSMLWTWLLVPSLDDLQLNASPCISQNWVWCQSVVRQLFWHFWHFLLRLISRWNDI